MPLSTLTIGPGGPFFPQKLILECMLDKTFASGEGRARFTPNGRVPARLPRRRRRGTRMRRPSADRPAAPNVTGNLHIGHALTNHLARMF